MFLNITLHAPMGIISVRVNIGVTFIFIFHRRPIQSVVFVPVGLSFLRPLRQVLLGVEVSSVVLNGQLPRPGDRRNFDTEQDLLKMS